jgi:hypothetical protein
MTPQYGLDLRIYNKETGFALKTVLMDLEVVKALEWNKYKKITIINLPRGAEDALSPKYS